MRARDGSLGQEVEVLDAQTRVLELLMLRLRTSRGLQVKAYREMTGRDFVRDHQRLVQALHENGLIRIRNGYLRLTRSGMLVSNSILSNLFARTREVLNQGLPPGARPHVKPAVGTGAGSLGEAVLAEGALGQVAGQPGDMVAGAARAAGMGAEAADAAQDVVIPAGPLGHKRNVRSSPEIRPVQWPKA